MVHKRAVTESGTLSLEALLGGMEQTSLQGLMKQRRNKDIQSSFGNKGSNTVDCEGLSL